MFPSIICVCMYIYIYIYIYIHVFKKLRFRVREPAAADFQTDPPETRRPGSALRATPALRTRLFCTRLPEIVSGRADLKKGFEPALAAAFYHIAFLHPTATLQGSCRGVPDHFECLPAGFHSE